MNTGSMTNARKILIDLGVAPFLTTMSIPFMFLLPGATDPDSPSVIEIVKAIQRGLKKLGYKKVMVSGVVDRDTAAALDHVAPPRGSWMQRTWVTLAGDILRRLRAPKSAPIAMGEDPMGYVRGYGPLPGKMVGLPPGPLGMGDSATDQGVSLTFGQGIKTPSNIIPVPKDSGPTFDAFRNLQRQINRLLSKIPGSIRIGEDAIIGDSTRKALEKIVAGIPFGIKIPVGNTVNIAKNAVTWGQILKDAADKAGVSYSANLGSPATPARAFEPPAAPLPENKVLSLSQAGFFGFLDQVPGGKFLPFVALGLGAAWFAVQHRKKSKRST